MLQESIHAGDMFIYIYVHALLPTYMCMHVHLYVHMFTADVHWHMGTCMYINTYITNIHMYVCL